MLFLVIPAWLDPLAIDYQWVIGSVRFEFFFFFLNDKRIISNNGYQWAIDNELTVISNNGFGIKLLSHILAIDFVRFEFNSLVGYFLLVLIFEGVLYLSTGLAS